MKINDLDLSKENWKKTKDKILTDSLWIIPKRNNKYGSNKFHGNFISEIPEQFILRYTKKGEIVWDCFGGSGTTQDVAKELGRLCISNDVNPIREKGIVLGDTRNFNPGMNVQLVIMHPPYAGIIRFSDRDDDISNGDTPEEFYPKFEECVKNVLKYLEDERYLILIMGDCYLKGTYIPMAFECMNICRKNGLQLKAEIIKNMEGNSNNKDTNLWLYRGLKGGFFRWKHEHIFVFKKKIKNGNQ